MTMQVQGDSSQGFYDRKYSTLMAKGHSAVDAAESVASDYLDGKPQSKGRQKVTARDRHALFWSSQFLGALRRDIWVKEPMVLALARYLSQETVSNTEILNVVARVAPETIVRAVRYSGLVLRPQSEKRRELQQLADRHGSDFAELTRILEIFGNALALRLDDVSAARSRLACLSPLELLSYASLYAFDRLASRAIGTTPSTPGAPSDLSSEWDAINDLLVWKLSESPECALHLSERSIGRSFSEHLSPFLFPQSVGHPPRFDLLDAFNEAMRAQLELNSFVAHSADAFSYDDSVQFVRAGNSLDIVEVDAELRAAWKRDGDRLSLVNGYWFNRAIDEFIRSEYALRCIGRPENHHANQIAVIRAMSSKLRLQQVYGVDDVLVTDSGAGVDLLMCLLSLELMSAFFTLHFLVPHSEYVKQSGDSIRALGQLAWQGLVEGMENRFPLTWSERAAKIKRIKGWTVTPETPEGSAHSAGAILDFWSSDWIALSKRFRQRDASPHPHLLEKPVLKLGNYLFELPWMLALQDNHVAAINNLRRVGARRRQAASEAKCVETQLARLFEARGFRVVSNWMPSETDDQHAGEIDLLCARDGLVFVVEVKSSYFRRTMRDAWLHGVTSLRTAGRQLRRKVDCVSARLSHDVHLRSRLGLAAGELPTTIVGWIVDTSIEQDHRRFSGFLKVSFEEVMVALRDDRDLLRKPERVLGEGVSSGKGKAERDARWTLYPEGFSARRFVEIIEGMLIWEVPPFAAPDVAYGNDLERPVTTQFHSL